MSTTHGIPGGRTSRRHLLRLATGAVTLAALGAGASGCRTDDGNQADDEQDTGRDKPDGDDDPGDAGDGEAGGAPEPLWTKPTSAQTYGNVDELVAVDGVVMASGAPLAALDGATGEEEWSLEAGAAPGAPLLLGKGTLYLASSTYDGTITGYQPASGKETWRGRLGEEFRQPRPIAVDDQQVYVIAEILEDDGSSSTNVIAALNSDTGTVVWWEQRDVGTEQTGVHAAVQGRHLVYTDFRQNLTVRDTATGTQVWTQKTTQTNYGSFAVHENLVIVPQGQLLQAFDLAGGAEQWSLPTGDHQSFREPAVVEGVLYVADSARTLRALDPATGKEIWTSEDLADGQRQAPARYVTVGDTLYGATDLDEQGGIHAFDATTGALRWTFNDGTGDHRAWLVATDGERVFALHGETLHALPG